METKILVQDSEGQKLVSIVELARLLGLPDPPPPKRMVKKTVWQNWYQEDDDIFAREHVYESQKEALRNVSVHHGVHLGAFSTQLEYEKE